MNDKIELLGEDLIDEYPMLAMGILGASSRLGISLGWHYVLDIIWILKELKCPPSGTILDAGAGTGLLQFILADDGYTVISADVAQRGIPQFARGLYRFEFRGTAMKISHSYLDHSSKGYMRRGFATSLKDISRKVFNILANNSRYRIRKAASNKTNNENTRPLIVFYHCDLEDMREIENASIDAVVSVSALEHNPPEKTYRCVEELSRVLKPNGKMYITVSATASDNSFHEPSHSWLLNEQSLVQTYQLNKGYQSNFSKYTSINSSIRNSRYLRKWLSSTYYRSGNNGMPWGVWDPKYQPVAILKIKR